MIRLPLPKDRVAERVELTRAERHYLVDVLRLRDGAALEVFDGAGGRYPARLEGEATLVLGPRAEEVRAGARIGLAQALAKGDKMDLVVEKATELGAGVIAPFAGENSVVRLDARRAEERLERWRRIAASAARQCGRADVPELLPVTTLDQAITEALARGERVLVLYEKEHQLRLSSALLAGEGPVLLVAGPEGGFSPTEIERARELGAVTVTLGERVLRTETVALAALAVTQHLRGDFA